MMVNSTVMSLVSGNINLKLFSLIHPENEKKVVVPTLD